MANLGEEVTNRLSAELRSSGIQIAEMTIFADLCWTPVPSLEAMLADPAMVVFSPKRWAVVHRVSGTIRYYIGPRPYLPGDRFGVDRDPEIGPSEWGVLNSVDDAIQLIEEYLSGAPLATLKVPRSKVGWR